MKKKKKNPDGINKPEEVHVSKLSVCYYFCHISRSEWLVCSGNSKIHQRQAAVYQEVGFGFHPIWKKTKLL